VSKVFLVHKVFKEKLDLQARLVLKDHKVNKE
jgi:hypothetical protein